MECILLALCNHVLFKTVMFAQVPSKMSPTRSNLWNFWQRDLLVRFGAGSGAWPEDVMKYCQVEEITTAYTNI